jgi:hypothetical protein
MHPTLRDGDLLLVRYGRKPRPGSVVVVRLPEGRPLSVKRAAQLTPDGWWIERDNEADGVDSWLVGAIPPSDVIAVAVVRLWPRPRPLWRRRPKPRS